MTPLAISPLRCQFRRSGFETHRVSARANLGLMKARCIAGGLHPMAEVETEAQIKPIEDELARATRLEIHEAAL